MAVPVAAAVYVRIAYTKLFCKLNFHAKTYLEVNVMWNNNDVSPRRQHILSVKVIVLSC